MSETFAQGLRARGICDRCGRQYRLADLVAEVADMLKTDLLVCTACLDEDHPQLALGRTLVFDPQALKNPRPDNRADVVPNPLLVGYSITGAPLFE